MNDNTLIIYHRLIDVARNRRTIFYDDLTDDIVPRPRGRILTRILNTINQHEVAEKRPLLSALAVRRGYCIPSSGFFVNAQALGRYNDAEGDDTSRAAFWVAEVHRVWDSWVRRADE